MSRRVQTLLRTTFALLGFSFLAWALTDALRDPDLSVIPPASVLGLATVLVALGLWSAVLGWSALLGSPVDRRLARGFLLAQLGKYVPGGVWQVIGQIGMAAPSVGSGARATTAFVASVATQVAGGLTVGSALALSSDAPVWARVGTPVTALAALSLLLLPGWMQRAVRLVPPLQRRLGSGENFPDRSALLKAWGWAVATMAVAGTVFLLAYRTPADATLPGVAAAYAVAWTVGFLAVPVPAGLGVREAALVLLLPQADRTALVAAAAVVRLLYIAGEIVAIATTIGPVDSARPVHPDDEVRQQAEGEEHDARDEEE